jgi:hypothetical protein
MGSPTGHSALRTVDTRTKTARFPFLLPADLSTAHNYRAVENGQARKTDRISVEKAEFFSVNGIVTLRILLNRIVAIRQLEAGFASILPQGRQSTPEAKLD